MTVMVIRTVGDVRRLLAELGPESDNYPFLVSNTEDEPADLVTASIDPNCDGHPPYVTMVLSDLAAESAFLTFYEQPNEWTAAIEAEVERRRTS